MKFFIRRRRTAPTVIVVALIDVLIVLVIFLMVTTTFKQVPSVQLELPKSSQALKPGENENPPLLVTITPGTPRDAFYFGANNYPVTWDNLTNQIFAAAAKNPKVKLAVRADKASHWETMVAVMDAAKAAHIQNISAFTKNPGNP